MSSQVLMYSLAKYHANGAQDDDLVLLELAEITTSLDSAKANKSESFRQFMRTPGNRKRFVLLSFVVRDYLTLRSHG